jgi:hypothetical protein
MHNGKKSKPKIVNGLYLFLLHSLLKSLPSSGLKTFLKEPFMQVLYRWTIVKKAAKIPSCFRLFLLHSLLKSLPNSGLKPFLKKPFT